MFYLKINFINLSLMANNSNSKTQTEDWNFSAFIKKIFRYKKISRYGISRNKHTLYLYGKSESQALRFY